MERILTIGLDEGSNADAVRIAGEHEGVFAAVGRHPNSAGGFDDAAADAIEGLAADPLVRAIGETGLDYYRDRASEEDQVRAFEAQIAIAGRAELPLVIHLRDSGGPGAGRAVADAYELLAAEAEGVEVILHCFSATAERAEEAVERGWYLSFAGNVDLPGLGRAAGGGRARSRRPAAGRDRQPVPLAAAGSQGAAEPPSERDPDRRGDRRGARGRLRGARRDRDGERRAAVRLVGAGRVRWSAWARTSSPTRTCSTRSSPTPRWSPATSCSRSAAGRGC